MALFIFLDLLALGILIGLLWRFSSQRWSIPCPTWLGWMAEVDNPFTKTNRANMIIDHLQLETGMKILDAGCGPGRVTIPLAQKTGPQGEVTAMDLQAGMLQQVEKKALAADLHNIRLVQAGIGDGKLECNQYERAVLVCVLGEIPNREAALKELFNAIKPGGILSVTEVIFDPHFQRVATVLQIANSVGFEQGNFFGNRFAFTLHLWKPFTTLQEP